MEPLIILYACADLFLAIHISFSNFIVIWVYVRLKHVRTPTNTYIFRFVYFLNSECFYNESAICLLRKQLRVK